MKTAALLSGALLCVLLQACGGNGSTPPQATLSPPPVDPRLQVLDQGTLTLDVPPGGRQTINPLSLAGPTPPPCAVFVLIFSYGVSEGGSLRFTGTRMGQTFEIVSGPKGEASVGCALIEAVNDGRERVDGQLRYFIAQTRD